MPKLERIIPKEQMSAIEFERQHCYGLIDPWEEKVRYSMGDLFLFNQYRSEQGHSYINSIGESGEINPEKENILNQNVWLSLPRLNQPTRDSCYISAAAFYLALNEHESQVDMGKHESLMQIGLANRNILREEIEENDNNITTVVGDLFGEQEGGMILKAEKSESILGIIGVKHLPRPVNMPDNIRKVETSAINGDNLVIQENKLGEEWWVWPNGHALVVVSGFWLHRYGEQGYILFDPMVGRLMLEFEKNLKNWMYPIGDRNITRLTNIRRLKKSIN